MYLTVQGLVLRVTAYNDTDALLSVLTRDHEKLTVKARGLLRKNSPLTAACQLLAYSEFTLFESRGYYTVNEARCIDFFHELRADLQKLSLATYFAQVAEILCQGDTPDPQLLSLLLNCLHGLTRLSLPEAMVKAVFELRVACLSGYTPDLSGCVGCGNAYPDRFNIGEGRLECAKCRDAGSLCIRLPITAGVLDAMRYICGCDAKKIFSFSVSDASWVQLSQLTESYLSTQLERGFSALDFYKSLFI